MAIPTSGLISIKATAGTCRNICAAVVQGGGGASGSLCQLSKNAGSPYSIAPYHMSDFYEYNPVSTLNVSMTIDWYGGFGPTDGWKGQVRLMCGASTVYRTCTVSDYVKYDEWLWTGIAAGSYCLNFSLINGYCNGFQEFIDKCWYTNGNSGVGAVTNTFSTTQTAYLGGYP